MNKVTYHNLKSDLDSILDKSKKSYVEIITFEDIERIYLPAFNALMEKTKLSLIESMCLACIYKDSCNGVLTDTNEIMSCYRFQQPLLKLTYDALESLEEKKWVILSRKGRTGLSIGCYLPDILIHLITSNPQKERLMDLREKLLKCGEFTYQIVYHHGFLKHYAHQIVSILRENNTQKAEEFICQHLEQDAELLLFAIVAAKSLQGQKFTEYNISFIENFQLIDESDAMMKEVIGGKSKLTQNKLLKIGMDSAAKEEYMSLGSAAMEFILGFDPTRTFMNEIAQCDLGHLEYPDKIKSVNLFYNQDTENQINRIRFLLSEQNYEMYHERMEFMNYGKGICILLHGDPGTGKTEFARQIARETGRVLYKVDASILRDKWFGNTEKNVAKLFSEYMALKQKSVRTPILFLNEADGIINKRLEVTHGMDITNVNIQNIFLEKIENFDGILIATTNMLINFDKAYDRRFLFKVQMQKPSAEVQMKLLRHKLPFIGESILMYLAENFDMTGAEINNIGRNLELERLIHGDYPEIDVIKDICISELNLRKNMKGGIGYVAA